MALVGWRSEYGGTVWGWTEEVAAEGVYFFEHQVQDTGARTVCRSDPSRLMTQEAPDSRFYGKGRVTVVLTWAWGLGHFSRVSQLSVAPHAPDGVMCSA